MHLLSFLKTAVLASFAITSIALPINTGDVAVDIRGIADKRAPPLPTVEECKAQLNVASDSTLFYSGPSGYAGKARQAIKARDYLKAYKILGQMWKNPSWQNQWQNDEQASKDFFDICSQALAEASSGTVYVLLPEDKARNWQSGTVWDRKEWPNIPSNAKVIRINPDNETQETIKG
ncbi:hypothetical protein F4820DRAFT_439979 [Hypoxylon rubiginosum]|uniref:Uncharacterized protein n=1 Tax=Hypoxylon rubiginosum TaxID=110542 RepID=A0ACB9YKB5_9PEZI|nr:hypothetical protein F4820DRAFT_439979 [Hypoxylon rubiginosum]